MALAYMPKFLYSQFFVTPPKPSTDCTGKTVIVTGANAGLGKEAARHFVRLNAAKVIIACRSPEKGEAAKHEIETTTGRQGVLEVWQLDLSSYESVKQFAERAKGLSRIDILLENAGIATSKFVSVGGNESTITVNVVSTFLLALLLLPKLQETGRKHNIRPNLVIVSSEVHYFTSFPERKASSIFGTLNSPTTANMDMRYYDSKLLEVLTVREVVKQHPELKVTLNFVTPGWCHSELLREISNPFVKLLKLIMCRTTEVGSRTLVDAGVRGPESHGQYLSDCKISPCAPLVEGPEGPELQRRVWQELSEKLEEIEPGVTKVLEA